MALGAKINFIVAKNVAKCSNTTYNQYSWHNFYKHDLWPSWDLNEDIDVKEQADGNHHQGKAHKKQP